MNSPKTSLQQMIDALPREVTPARNLWPGIDQAINSDAHASHFSRRWALAACITLMVGLSLYFGLRQPVPALPDLALEDYISGLQNEHQRSKQAILVEFQQQQALYPQWQDQLHELEQAENVVYDALRRDPDNRELLNILRDVQAKQLKLIDAVFAPQVNAI